jgi:hypothetical protein
LSAGRFPVRRAGIPLRRPARRRKKAGQGREPERPRRATKRRRPPSRNRRQHASLLRPGRHPGDRHLRTGGRGRRGGRWRRLGLVCGCFCARVLHRVRVRRARDEVSTRRRRSPVRPQGLRCAVRYLPRRLRRHGVGHHIGVHCSSSLRRRLPVSVLHGPHRRRCNRLRLGSVGNQLSGYIRVGPSSTSG